MPDEEAVFAYFGLCDPQAIDDLFLRNFAQPAERSGSRFEFKLSNGKNISIVQHENGVEKFRDTLLGHEEILKGLDYLLADNFLAEANFESEAAELKTWHQFSITASNDLDGFADLRALKDNLLISGGGIAFEYDNGEVTIRHACGGITGDYAY